MMHPMRRADRALSREEAMDILHSGMFGTLATTDEKDGAYATPLNYVLMDGAIYFHCAKQGRKLDNLARDPRVCFCVVGGMNPVYDGHYGVTYASAVVHGVSCRVEGDEKKRALIALCDRYLPQHSEHAAAYVEKHFEATEVVRIAIEQLSGKARKE